MKNKKTRMFSNNLYVIKKIWQFAPMFIIMNAVMAVSRGLYSAADILYMKVLFDSVGQDGEFLSALGIVLIMAAVTLIFEGFFWWYRQVYDPILKNKMHLGFHKELFDKAGSLDLSCYDDPVFYNDFVFAMQQSDSRAISVVADFGEIISRLVSLSSIIAILVTIDPWIAVIIFGVSVLAMFVGVYENKVRFNHKQEVVPLTRKKDYIHRIFYLVDYAKEIRISKVKENIFKEYKNNVNAELNLQNKYGKIYFGLRTFADLSKMIARSGVLVYMAYLLTVTKTIEIGGFAAAANSIWRLSWSLESIAKIMVKFPEHSLYIDKYISFLNYEPKIKSGTKKVPKLETLSLKNITFGYGRDDVLNDVSLDIKRGEKIALVGYNGAGKTTLIKMFMRLYDAKSGEILWNGINIKDFIIDEYREKIGSVFQDFKIFSATLGENVVGDEFKVDDSPIVFEALEKTGFTEKLKTMKNGLNTYLTREFLDSGTVLSGGECQKVVLARVLAHPYELILMDEPSSALDPIAEYNLNKSIIEKSPDKTIVFISHRLSTTRFADRIYMFEDGRIIEYGSHEALMALNGKYAAMFNMQGEKYKISLE